MSTSTLPAPQQQPEKVSQWLRSPTALRTIESALGGSLDSEKFISQMIVAFEKNPEVAKCTARSKFDCAYICATLGLSPTLGEVALIPRAGVLTAMPQWQGFQTLMMRNSYVKSLKARIIHTMDSYEFNAEDETLTHTYDPFAEGRVWTDWKDVKGGYLVIEFNDGTPKLYHCVSVETMKKARGCAQSDNIWKKWFYEQMLKTVYRNAFARRVVPMDQLGAERVAKLIETTDEVEGNNPDHSVQSAPATKPTSRVEQLKSMKAPATPAITEANEPEVIEGEITETQEATVASGSTDDNIDDFQLQRIQRVIRIMKKEVPDQAERIKSYAEWGVTNPADPKQWTDEALKAAVEFADQLEISINA